MNSRQRTVTFESKLSRISSFSPRWRPCSGEVRISGHGLTKSHCRRLGKAGPSQLGSSARDEDIGKDIEFSLEFYGFDPCGMVRCRAVSSKIGSSVSIGILSVVLLGSLVSCAGDGSGDNPSFKYQGVYSKFFTRSDPSSFVITIDGQKHVNVTVNDSGFVYNGSGTTPVSDDGTFTVTCNNDTHSELTPLVVTGQPDAMQSDHYTYKIDTTGQFTLSDVIGFYGGNNLGSLLAGTYIGTFQGDETGTVNVYVTSYGDATITEPDSISAPSSGANFLAGMKQSFAVKLAGVPTRTYNAQFTYAFLGVHTVSGTWIIESSGKKGTFFATIK
jgi:hypothetical protein